MSVAQLFHLPKPRSALPPTSLHAHRHASCQCSCRSTPLASFAFASTLACRPAAQDLSSCAQMWMFQGGLRAQSDVRFCERKCGAGRHRRRGGGVWMASGSAEPGFDARREAPRGLWAAAEPAWQRGRCPEQFGWPFAALFANSASRGHNGTIGSARDAAAVWGRGGSRSGGSGGSAGALHVATRSPRCSQEGD